ncbi:hypothetical protein HY546_03230 [archaeon]|nr:hypothetical protein [archaeon]
MHRVVILRIGGTQIHLLKLVGMLVMLGSAVMVLANVYKAGVVFDTLSQVNSGGTPTQAQLDLNGILVPKTLKPNDTNTQLGMLLVPLAGIIFWAIALIAGTVLYRYGGLIIPVEEDVGNVKSNSKKRR